MRRAFRLKGDVRALSDKNPTQGHATPEHFEQHASRCPHVNLVLGHAGGRHEGHLAAIRLAQRCQSVCLDHSGDVHPFGFIEWLDAQVEADRLLFGSNADWIDPRPHLGRILDADISLEAMRLILGDNAARIFQL